MANTEKIADEEIKNKELSLFWRMLKEPMAVLGLVLYAGGVYAVSQVRIEQTEQKIEKTVQWKEEYIEKQHQQYLDIINKLADIKTELQVIKNQMDYTRRENKYFNQ